MAARRLSRCAAQPQGAAAAGLGSKPVLHHRVPAERYRGVFLLRTVPRPPELPGRHLYYDESGMALICRAAPKGFRLRLGPIKARAGQALLLARACAAGKRPAVADLMAGWGLDGLCLASKGCAVTLVERSPLVWAMLDDFVLRHRLPAEVVWEEAGAWCISHGKAVDVAYLDPMFPPRGKTALPGKPMQLLRTLAWEDGLELAQRIEQAKEAARDRVVVKRRAGAAAAHKPSWQVCGRRLRFDVYRV